MSATVLPFKRPNGVAEARLNLSDTPRFFCLHCDTDRFVILSSGDVHCANCTAHMRNLFVHDSTLGQA